MLVHKIVSQAKTGVAAEIDFKPVTNRRAPRDIDQRFHNRRFFPEFQRDNLALAGVLIAFWLVQPNGFGLVIDFHNESPEKAGSQNPVLAPAARPGFRLKRRYPAR